VEAALSSLAQDLGTSAFWLALGSIILTNIVLSGDNAVVIALAARSLPKNQQNKAILFGSGAAIVMRIVLTIVAVQLLSLPWLKIVGSLLLLYIGVSLMGEEEDEVHHESKPVGVGAAIRTILIADLVMSLDNVLAVAAAAHGNDVLLILGLAISIPLIVFGSTLLLKVMERFPIIITAGAALLGWLAGEMMFTDPAIPRFFDAQPSHTVVTVAGIVGALLVVAIGTVIERRRRRRAAA
jgi:YjbE family integral membrane protein